MVPSEDIPIAIALKSSIFNTAQFIGPALASWLLALGGPGLAFSFAVFAAGIMVWALLAINVPMSVDSRLEHGCIFTAKFEGRLFYTSEAYHGLLCIDLVELRVLCKKNQSSIKY